MTDELKHEGVARRSGRYPWGSGENPEQRHVSFLGQVDKLRKEGMTDTEIARGLGMNTSELRARRTIALNAQKKAEQAQAQQLKERGLSNVAIGEKMGKNESSVRALLNPAAKERADILQNTVDVLKQQVEEKKYLDFGAGTEQYMGVSREKLLTAIALMKDENYRVHYLKVPQLGTSDQTTLKVLTKGDVTPKEVYANQDKIGTIAAYSENGGRSFNVIKPPVKIDPKRVSVVYGDEGGSSKDGVIELRRGVDDISLGHARYAQVRVAVGDKNYLKGMAMYADDLPDGVDIRFNTNKTKAQLQKSVDDGKAPDLKTAAMKGVGDDAENPFGSVYRQKNYIDKDGKEKLSALNIVNEEGDWSTWSAKLSSQVLSKQTPRLAKEQLGLRFDEKKAEYDEIMALTNPTVRKKLLESFADDADSSAVHLKAAGLPRTRQHVILPINSLKDNEVYAPNYNNGENVVLIRHPHGGIFEIPELRVNNQNKEARRLIKNSVDAIGINSKVASKLSGADFDGDTVLVIPNNDKKIKTKPALRELKNFDPQAAYPEYEGMTRMSPRTKQIAMGDISNLITDMTIRGANDSEIARAVKHSMVVIDAEKHKLNWRQSAKDNGIAELKTRYQGKANAGAKTLISRASSPKSVNEFKPRSAKDGGPIDPATGKKVFVETGNSYVVPAKTKVNPKTGKVTVTPERVAFKQTKVPRMALVDDANELSSGTVIEGVYANYANKVKALANQARKSAISTKPIPYSPSAKKVYELEVKQLNAKLNLAKRNAPLERQAQLLANAGVKARVQANPGMDKADLKKIKGIELEKARARTGASKARIRFTDSEWAAVQAGAISGNMLKEILNNADLDDVKRLATPRVNPVLNTARQARAKAMLANGYTQADIARALGVSATTVNSLIVEERKES